MPKLIAAIRYLKLYLHRNTNFTILTIFFILFNNRALFDI